MLHVVMYKMLFYFIAFQESDDMMTKSLDITIVGELIQVNTEMLFFKVYIYQIPMSNYFLNKIGNIKSNSLINVHDLVS